MIYVDCKDVNVNRIPTGGRNRCSSGRCPRLLCNAQNIFFCDYMNDFMKTESKEKCVILLWCLHDWMLMDVDSLIRQYFLDNLKLEINESMRKLGRF